MKAGDPPPPAGSMALGPSEHLLGDLSLNWRFRPFASGGEWYLGLAGWIDDPVPEPSGVGAQATVLAGPGDQIRLAGQEGVEKELPVKGRWAPRVESDCGISPCALCAIRKEDEYHVFPIGEESTEGVAAHPTRRAVLRTETLFRGPLKVRADCHGRVSDRAPVPALVGLRESVSPTQRRVLVDPEACRDLADGKCERHAPGECRPQVQILRACQMSARQIVEGSPAVLASVSLTRVRPAPADGPGGVAPRADPSPSVGEARAAHLLE